MAAKQGKISLFSLAFPILIEQVLRNFLGTVNVLMLGNFSDEAVAAVGVANQIMNVVIMAFTMLANGAAVVINQHLGARHDEQAGQISMNAIGVGVLLGGVISAFFIACSPFVMMLMGLEGNLIADASTYLQWVGGASVMISVSSVISVLFRCYGNAKVPMAIVLFINIVNVIGNYLVIFRPFEIPLYGISGIGIIRFASETIGLLLSVLLLAAARFGYKLKYLWRIKLHTLGQIVSIGFMSGAEGISYTLGQVVTTGFLGAFGTAALSAKVYVQTIDYYAYVIGQSIGQASQIIAGQMMGAGETEEAYHFINKKWKWIMACNLFFSGAIFVFHRPIMAMFTSTQEIIDLSMPLFALCIFINFGRSFNHCFNYGLRAAGYVFWPMMIAVGSIWIVNVGLGYVFSTQLGLGITGLWISMAMDDILRGAATGSLWRTKLWKKSISVLKQKKTVPQE